MIKAKLTVLSLVVVLFGSLATGRLLQDTELDVQSERTAQSISDAHGVINAALGNADALPASTKSLVYARLGTRDTTEPWMADGSTGARKLQQQPTDARSNRISQSLSAASDVIAKAVAAGSSSDATNRATQRSADYARLTTVDAEPWMFDTGARKLQQQPTDARSNRISQSLSAASDVIAKAVAAGSSSDATNRATQRSADYARLTTVNAEPWMFDTGARKLLQTQQNSRGDRISQSISAASDVIAKAVAAGGDGEATNTATRRSADYARLTTLDVEPWAFDTNSGGARK
jgi:hypothetical protein